MSTENEVFDTSPDIPEEHELSDQPQPDEDGPGQFVVDLVKTRTEHCAVVVEASSDEIAEAKAMEIAEAQEYSPVSEKIEAAGASETVC